jgi:hypothetical protein
MGFLDRLFGSTDPTPEPPRAAAASDPRSEDERAVERYRYLLRTAPPETIEQVHAEAFARLTDEQRRQVLAEMSTTLPEAERPRSDDPSALARAATRAEYTNPGYLERTLGPQQNGRGGGMGFGAMVGSSLLGTLAGYVIGSALVSSFMGPESGADEAGSEAGADSEGGGDPGTAGGDPAADAGGSDSGGDFGGGEFGGGGFGGGDFGGGFGGDIGF